MRLLTQVFVIYIQKKRAKNPFICIFKDLYQCSAIVEIYLKIKYLNILFKIPLYILYTNVNVYTLNPCVDSFFGFSICWILIIGGHNMSNLTKLQIFSTLSCVIKYLAVVLFHIYVPYVSV